MKLKQPSHPDAGNIADNAVIAFLAQLHVEFAGRRKSLLLERDAQQRAIDQGDFSNLSFIRQTGVDPDWVVAPLPPALRVRRVELTSPPERKRIINGLNSGADAFIADFDDALSPTWENVTCGHRNIRDAVEGSLTVTATNGNVYAVEKGGTHLFFRPRGIHLVEKHIDTGGDPLGASIFDVGLFVYHCARKLAAFGRPICIYIPKIELVEEARFWRDLFVRCEELFQLAENTIKAAVIIESVQAAFRIEPILHTLKDRSAGLSCGRWDYVFSHIKTFRNHPEYLLPERDQIDFNAPLLRALAGGVLHACRERDTCAIGFMSAYIPSRGEKGGDTEAKREFQMEKEAEAREGFDGTWVAHPSLVKDCQGLFRIAGEQLPRKSLAMTKPTAGELVAVPRGRMSRSGIQRGVRLCLQYFSEWLHGRGAIRLDDRMEDTATAEIWRCQIWQWLHRRERDVAGEPLSKAWLELIVQEEVGQAAAEGIDLSQTARWLLEVWESASFLPYFTSVLYDDMP